ncbi:MAG: CDP-glycerol glycerophosphotransferase family protein [Ignavibacteria bacterium]|nr:CDP-glycerol glycerophosphotransferase family protein [Ignavibacteria bacterium]
MNGKKILYMCGSLNQTTMLHQISKCLPGHEHFFTAYYSDGAERVAARLGFLDFSVLGGKFRAQTESYLQKNDLAMDYRGEGHKYDLIVVCSDIIMPKNLRNKKMVMVQEGMTDPENIFYHMVKKFRIPRYFGGTATTGLSDFYTYFCVASEGYRELFIRKGIKQEKIIITGIPNFDNCVQFLNNDFPYKNYALVCSSDSRETYKYENRKKFIQKAVSLSEGKKMIFKLHPNENVERATKEINKYAPGSMIFSDGNTNEMIANCDILVTHYSTVVYVGMVLGKKIYSSFKLEELKQLIPIQNKGESAKNIADVCSKLLEGESAIKNSISPKDNKDKFDLTYQTA